MDIGKVIQSLREKQDISQKELADKIGISYSVMNRIESGGRPARDDEVIRIAKVLNVSTDYLLGVSNDIHKEDKHAPVDDVEKAMEIILEQPGLMLKGTILSDESKIILANAIQMGLRTAEELEKKKIEGDSNEG